MMDAANATLHDIESSGDGSQFFTTLSPRAYLSNIGLSQSMGGMTLSLQNAPSDFPILHIRDLITNLQMGRIAAWRIVTFVKTMGRSIVTNRDEKRHAGCNESFGNDSKISVSVFIESSLPWPTFVWCSAFDFRPKSLDVFFGEIHKKTARQSKCACGSSGSRPNWKVVAGSCSTGDRRIAKYPMEATFK